MPLNIAKLKSKHDPDSRNSQDSRNFRVSRHSRDSPESQNSPEILILSRYKILLTISVPSSSRIRSKFCKIFLSYICLTCFSEKKVKIDRKKKEGDFIKKGWRFTTNHAVFSSKNINCVAFPRGSPLYEVITRRGIMDWFSKVKGTLEGIFSLIMRTGQKAAKETSHRLCLHGQLFKVALPCRLIASGLGKQSCCYMNN